MLEFSDAPYCFFEADPSRPLIWLGRQINRHLILPGPKHRIREIEVGGESEALLESVRNGERLLFVINHPTHSDAQILTEVHRRLGVDSCFMAAYDVFLRSPFCAWSMRKMGNFSIDREGSDRKAMAAAIDVLKNGERALNIFPEGNVFLTNDRVAPFLDGAAFIAIKAQSALDGIPVKIVPVSLKYTHITAPREAVTERMLELARRSGYEFPAGATSDPVSAVMALGRHIVAEFLRNHGKGEGIGGNETELYDQLASFAATLAEDLEAALEIPPPENTELCDRIIKVRSRLHQLRTVDPNRLDPALDGLADKAILALRINGYLIPYLTRHPTIDRYDETVERIAEDYYSKAMPRTGPKRAMVRIGAPIDVADFVGAAGGKARQAIPNLTAEMRRAVQQGVDSLNASNDAPGATLVR